MPITHINFLAVVVAAIATFGLGALWYSPLLFGKLWMTVQGFSEEQLATMRQGIGRTYLVSFLCYVFMAFVLTILVMLTGVASFIQGMWLGTLVWAGFVFTIGLTGNLFSDKPLAAFLIDTGYQLIYLTLMGGILAAWR